LFASDGYCGIKNGGICASIIQHNSITLLGIINELLDTYKLAVGSIIDGALLFYGANAFKFLQLIQPHMIGQKVKQIELLLQLYQDQQIRHKIDKRCRRTEKERAKHQHTVELVKKLKHM